VTLDILYQSFQFGTWLIALVELILGLYILVLNARHNANRHTGFLLLLSAATTYAIGWLSNAKTLGEASIPVIALAVMAPILQPVYFLAAISIVRPEWQRAKTRWLLWLVFLFTLLPAALTVADLMTGMHYWFTGLGPDYSGGYVRLEQFTSGDYAFSIHSLTSMVFPALTTLTLLYLALFDRRISPNNKPFTWLLLIGGAIASLFPLSLSSYFLPEASILIPVSIFALTISIASFRQMVMEKRSQRGSLQTRLTALILVVSIPLLIAVSAFVASQADALLKVAAQLPEEELLTAARMYQQMAALALGVGIVLLLLLAWLAIRQALLPIGELTAIASAISAGDLTRVASIQSEDEIGTLARAFNSMTTQLREAITNLERRVAERTRDLERRAVQLQVAADVASQAAAIRDVVEVMNHTVRLISDRFNFYHAGIFLLDENAKYAVLRAASSEGGQRMLARGHKLAVGQVGIVGYVAGKAEARIALDVGSDAVYFNNPDLPQTRSEMALPLKVRERVIGVLDVQSTKASAFTNEDVEILQILADQVALAIENAQLLSESQKVIQELGTLYQQQVRRSWQQRLEDSDIIYSYRQGKVIRELSETVRDEEASQDPRLLKLPIILRGQGLGWITLRRNPEAQPWGQEEIDLAQKSINQLALVLENARLMEENRQRALKEELIGNVTARTQGLLDVDTVMKTAVQEIGRALGLARIQIQFSDGEQVASTPPLAKKDRLAN
jgi:GAF domain-containing protein/HAMP domain-containing protein